MQYFHRTQLAPDAVIVAAAGFFGPKLSATDNSPRRLGFASPLGGLTVSVRAEGGHYTLITVATDQPGESEIDRLAKRFLGEVHRLNDPAHALRGAY